MNELERLLSAIRPPGPSEQFDQRMRTLLAEPPRRFKNHWRNAASLFAAAACAGMIGFWLGRQSPVITQPPSPPVIASSPAPTVRELVSDNHVKVSLRSDQLARLFVNSRSPEHLLGRGMVEVQVSTPPQD